MIDRQVSPFDYGVNYIPNEYGLYKEEKDTGVFICSKNTKGTFYLCAAEHDIGLCGHICGSLTDGDCCLCVGLTMMSCKICKQRDTHD